MTPTYAPDDLYDLIQSLDPAEKRYFKLNAEKYITSGYKSQYEKLYDALQYWNQEMYDEKEFKKVHRGKTFIKNLTQEKSYLKELLLKTLRNYHAQNDAETMLHETLVTLKILLAKGLNTQAYKLIERSKKQALEREQLIEVLILNDFLFASHKVSVYDQPYNINEIIEQEEILMARIKTARKLKHLSMKIFEINNFKQWDSHKEEVTAIIEQIENLAQTTVLTTAAKIYYANAKITYLIHKREYTTALDLMAATLLQLEGQMSLKGKQYISLLSNNLFCAYVSERMDLIPPLVSRLEAISPGSIYEAVEVYRHSTQGKLVYYINTDAYAGTEVAGELVKTKNGLIKYKKFLSNRDTIEIINNLLAVHFYRKEYQDSLPVIDHLLTLIGRDTKYYYILLHTKLIAWMCLASIGAWTSLENDLRSIKRHITENNIENDSLNEILILFKLIIKEESLTHTSVNKQYQKIIQLEDEKQWGYSQNLLARWKIN